MAVALSAFAASRMQVGWQVDVAKRLGGVAGRVSNEMCNLVGLVQRRLMGKE